MKKYATLCLVVLAFINPCAMAQKMSFDAISIIGQQKSSCEHWAMVAKMELPKSQLNTAEERYVRAKSTFDGWIGQLRFAVQERKNLANSDMYNQTLKNAAVECGSFTDYVLQHRLKRVDFKIDCGPLKVEAGLVKELGKTLTEAGVLIWEKAQKSNDDEQKKLLAELERNRFEPWEKIPEAVVEGSDEMTIQTLLAAARGLTLNGQLDSAGSIYKSATKLRFTSFQTDAYRFKKVTDEYEKVLKMKNPKEYSKFLKMSDRLSGLLKSYEFELKESK